MNEVALGPWQWRALRRWKFLLAAMMTCLPVRSLTAQASPWTVRADRSEMTDQPLLLITQPSGRPISGVAGGSIRPLLFVRCREGVLSAGVAVAGLVPDRDSDSEVQVRVRWDDYPVVDVYWEVSDNLNVIWVPNELLWSFVYEGMVPANRLRLGIATYRQGEVILEYSMAGFTQLVPRLQESCKGAMNLD